MKKIIAIAGSALVIGVTATGLYAGGTVQGKVQEEKPAATEATPQAMALTETVQNETSGDVQEITANVESFGYPEITVESNRPVRINFKVTEENLNACNNELYIPEWNITKKLTTGDNFIEFTPTSTGTFNFSCWMGMINSSITVVEAGTAEIGAQPVDESANYAGGCSMRNGSIDGSSIFGNGMGGGCCGIR